MFFDRHIDIIDEDDDPGLLILGSEAALFSFCVDFGFDGLLELVGGCLSGERGAEICVGLVEVV